ncbi:MAG: hypothetical protein M0P77_06090 [Firmicutes bacterium]|nr:hypothetical protein [Bacillota bacterium]
MFLYEEHLKAIKLLLQYDMSYSTVRRELGYPSKESLRNWYYEYRKEGKLHRDFVKKAKYSEEEKLNSRILNMSFIVSDRDVDDWNEFDFEEVIDEIWINFNIERIILYLMYATYQITKGKDRAQSLYGHLRWNKEKNIKIEDIFRIGPEELKDLDTFMGNGKVRGRTFVPIMSIWYNYCKYKC